MRFFSFTLEEIRQLKHLLPLHEDIFPYDMNDMEGENNDPLWLIPYIPTHDNNQFPTSLVTRSKKAKPLSQLTTLFFPKKANMQFSPQPHLAKKLKGRRLLFDELDIDLFTLQEHISHGWISFQPGIIQIGAGFQCVRCGNEDRLLFATFPCFRCKEECLYCRSCLMMGKVTACSPLYKWKGPVEAELHPVPIPQQEKLLTWDGTLSFFQQKASDKLCESIAAFYGSNEQNRAKDQILLWAVCGSGKTEMLFHGIELARQMGLSVLVATPRTDVVLELEPRLKDAFPTVDIHAFYGGADDRFAQGELVISTTHQLLRFYKAFDLVIIDEVDAFPYSADRKLRYAVSKAKKERAMTVFVTATPEEKMKRDAENGDILSAKVARRYHGHPLPLPRNVWTGQWKKLLARGRLPKVVMKFLQDHLRNSKQVFLFVPSVPVLNDVVKVLKEGLAEVAVDGVHSADEDRREKVMDFRDGKINVLVTTTILERGVTVTGVQVAVLGAEDRIFTESALVQIAGRAGRKPIEPSGDVVYFHYGKTEEMVKAIRHIRDMNKLGEKELAEEKLLEKGEGVLKKEG